MSPISHPAPAARHGVDMSQPEYLLVSLGRHSTGEACFETRGATCGKPPSDAI